MTKKPDLPSWSWIVSILGLLLVGGSTGYTVYKSVNKQAMPPDIVIEQNEIFQKTSSYLVQIRITNKGGSAASKLVIEGSLLQNGESVEKSTIIVDYAPSGSSRNAGLFFTRDPRSYQLQLRALGYEEP